MKTTDQAFDEAGYLAANPDVRDLLQQGVFTCAEEHWKAVGLEEHENGHRLSGFLDYDLLYDESTYLAHNHDVAAAVRGGEYVSGYQHWVRYGRHEYADGRRVQCFAPISVPFDPMVTGRLGGPRIALVVCPCDEAVRVRVSGGHMFLAEDDFRVSQPLWVSREQELPVRVRMLICRLPPRRVAHTGLDVISGTGMTATVSLSDVGGGMAFHAFDDIARFVEAGCDLALAEPPDAQLVMPAVTDFVSSRLRSGDGKRPDPAIRIEELLSVKGLGVFAKGWMVPCSRDIAWLKAVCLQTGEVVEVTDSVSRNTRHDVAKAYGFGPSSDETFGFTTLLRMPKASALSNARIVIGIQTKDGRHTVTESRIDTPGCFTDQLSIALGALDAGSPALQQALRDNIGPTVASLWRTERASKSRDITAIRFGKPPPSPTISLLVPLFGRCDFLKTHLAIFANDPDIHDGAVELIYFVDDPRIIAQTTQLAENCHPAYGVPFTIAYTGENHGYAGANNLAASLATSPLLGLMNSDVFPKKQGWLRKVIDASETLADCGIIGIKLLYPDESLQHGGMIFESFPFWGGMYGNNHPGKGLPNSDESNAPPREVEAVTGAFMAVKRDLFDAVGGLTEDFVLGDFEDSELCLKVRSRGARIWYLPYVEAYHLERQSLSLMGNKNGWRHQLTVYNCWLQQAKWLDLLQRTEKNRKRFLRAEGRHHV